MHSSGISVCNALTLDDELPQAIPTSVKNTCDTSVDMPKDVHPDLIHIINNHKQLFSTQLGRITAIEHVIVTGDALPVKVPPHPIPFHFAERIHNQLQEMAH